MNVKTKKLISFILFFTLLALSYAESVKSFHGNGVFSGERAIVTDNKINVRSSVGMGGEKIFQLNAGDLVDVIEECSERLFVDGAYSKWFKIRCKYGTGYVCGRWMSRYFIELKKNGAGAKEYLVYEYYYRIYGDEYADWPDSEIYADRFMYIKNGSVNNVEGLSYVPQNKNYLYCPPEMELVHGIGEDNNITILLRTDLKYGAGRSTEVAFCCFNGSDRLIEIVKEDGFYEGGYYKKPYINFKSKAYDVMNAQWDVRKTDRAEAIVVTVEEETFEDGKKVINKREYVPGK